MESIASWVMTYLVNALWEIPLAGLAVWLADKLLRRASMADRHLLWSAALLVAVLLPAASLRHPVEIGPVPLRSEEASGIGGAGAESRTSPVGLKAVATPANVVWTVSGMYILLLFVMSARFLNGVRGFHRVRQEAVFCPWPAPLQAAEEAARAVTGLLPVPILCSNEVGGPLTAGVRNPVIVLPEAVFYSNSAPLLRSVVGHEMAHIARHDFLRKLLWEALFIPVAFHPVAWLVRRGVERTRELACDELVTGEMIDAGVYARSLLEVARTAAAFRNPAQSLGILDGNILEKRVRILMNRRKRFSWTAGRLAATTAICALAFFGASLASSSVPLATWGMLEGRVFDASGAVVPGASVIIAESRTGVRRSLITSGSGEFCFRSLPVGQYTLAVKKRGFRAFHHRHIYVGRTLRVNPVLTLGVVHETVTVAARAGS